MLRGLSSQEYFELIEYLKESKYFAKEQWRDNTLALIAYYLSLQLDFKGSKPKYESFLPPQPLTKEANNGTSSAQVESNLRVMAQLFNSVKSSKAKKEPKKKEIPAAQTPIEKKPTKLKLLNKLAKEVNK